MRKHLLGRTPFILADKIRLMGRKVGGLEIIDNAGFETENLFGRLIHEGEIKKRLEFLVDRTLKVTIKTAADKRQIAEYWKES